MKPPMPGQLTAVRVILFVHVAIAAVGLLSFLVLMSVSGLPLARVMAETGTTVGLFTLEMLFGVGILVLELVVALRMGAGGRRVQILLRVALLLAVVGTLVNVVQGSGYLGFALMLVALVLAETRNAKDWFADTEDGQETHQTP